MVLPLAGGVARSAEGVVTSTAGKRKNGYTKILLKMFLKKKLDLSTVTVSTMIHNELQRGTIVINVFRRVLHINKIYFL
jgi:hypothetical protein